MNYVFELAVDRVKTGLDRFVHRHVRPVEVMDTKAPKVAPPSAETQLVDMFERRRELVIVADAPGADAKSTSAHWDGETNGETNMAGEAT